jgi:glycine C-acetyltransferase
MPAIAHASIRVLGLLQESDALRQKLVKNAEQFRREMTKLGFKLAGAGHPIIPVMLGDASLAQTMANKLLAEGIYVVGFSFPVVPKGAARIRTQMSAAHEPRHIERAVAAFAKVGRELGVIK